MSQLRANYHDRIDLACDESARAAPTGSMKALIHLTTICLATLLVACGSAIAPGPTTKGLAESDILGTWSHTDSRAITREDTASYSVTVELLKGGAFLQTIRIDGESEPLQQEGQWQLDGSKIVLSDILSEDFDSNKGIGTWTKQEAHWWFVDWYDSNREVALFGGLHPDPDSFSPWTLEK